MSRRMQVWMVTSLLTGGLAVGLRLAFAKAEALESKDPKTWEKLVTKDDFLAVVSFQKSVIEKQIKTPGTFNRGYAKLQQAGHMIAMMGNIGTILFPGDTAKRSASLRDAGLELAKASEKKKYDDAKKAADIILGFPQNVPLAANATTTKWTDIVPLKILMKEVAAMDNATKESLTKPASTFTKDAPEIGMQARTVAYLSVIARDFKADDNWKGWCDDMREGVYKVADELIKKNQPTTKAAYGAMQTSCSDCHKVFRADLVPKANN